MAEINYARTLAVTVFVGVVYIVVGWISWSYPADYLPMSWVWSSLMIAGGSSVLLFTVFPKRWLALISGTLVVSTSVLRGLYIEATLGWDFWNVFLPDIGDPQRSSFAIAGLTWITLGVMIFVTWPLAATVIMDERGGLNE